MNHIEHVFFINLEKRKDRLQEIENEFKQHNIIYYERFNAVLNEQFGALGCTKSHYEVLKMAKQRNYKNVLIFEDDFKFIVDENTFFNEINQIFDNGVKFDIVKFAYNMSSYEDCHEYPFLWKIHKSYSASCYLVNHTCYDELLAIYEKTIPLYELNPDVHWLYINDVIWHEIMAKGNCYATKTRCGVQRNGWSDNSQMWTNYGC